MTVTNVDLMWMFNNEKSVSVPALVTNGRKYVGWQPCNNFTSIIPSWCLDSCLMDEDSKVNSLETTVIHWAEMNFCPCSPFGTEGNIKNLKPADPAAFVK